MSSSEDTDFLNALEDAARMGRSRIRQLQQEHQRKLAQCQKQIQALHHALMETKGAFERKLVAASALRSELEKRQSKIAQELRTAASDLKRAMHEKESLKLALSGERKRFMEARASLEIRCSDLSKTVQSLQEELQRSRRRIDEGRKVTPRANWSCKKTQRASRELASRLRAEAERIKRESESERIRLSSELERILAHERAEKEHYKAELDRKDALGLASQKQIESLRHQLSRLSQEHQMLSSRAREILSQRDAAESRRAEIEASMDRLHMEAKRSQSELEILKEAHSQELALKQNTIGKLQSENERLLAELKRAHSESLLLREKLDLEQTKRLEIRKAGLQSLLADKEKILADILAEKTQLPDGHPIHEQLERLLKLQKEHREKLSHLIFDLGLDSRPPLTTLSQ